MVRAQPHWWQAGGVGADGVCSEGGGPADGVGRRVRVTLPQLFPL